MKHRFRRRGFRRRRRGGKWLSSAFLNAIDMETQVTTFHILAEYPNFTVEDSDLKITKNVRARRVIVEANNAIRPLIGGSETTLTQFAVFFYALFVLDVDDNDASIIETTQHSIVQSARVLHRGVSTIVWTAPANAGDALGIGYVADRISIDWRGSVLLRPDDQLVLGVQRASPTGDQSLFGGSVFAANTRVLIQGDV